MLEAWPDIEFRDDRDPGRSVATVRRKPPSSRPESRPESPLEARVLATLAARPRSKSARALSLGQKGVSGQLKKIIAALLGRGEIEFTIPEKPGSRLQQYRLGRGRRRRRR